MQERAERVYPATIDAETGIYDHQTIGCRIAEELARAHRYNYPLSMLLVSFRSAEPQRAGERVLQLVELLRRHVRSADILGRPGQDTIALLLPHTGEQGARRAAERIAELATVMQPPAGLFGNPVPVQIGIATLPQGYCDDGCAVVDQVAGELSRDQDPRTKIVAITLPRTGSSPVAWEAKK